MLTVNEIIDFFKLQNSHAKKELGQNFLINNQVCDFIVSKLDIVESDKVLEIGPGLGALTDIIVNKSSNYTVVEYDQKFVDFLRREYEGKINIIKNIWRNKLWLKLVKQLHKLEEKELSIQSIYMRQFKI